MKLSTIFSTAAFSALASAQLTYTLVKSAAPTADETDAYARITSAMDAGIARYVALGSQAFHTLTVKYNTGVPTADANIDGQIQFGASRDFMTECTALHEIAHTLGVSTWKGWADTCAGSQWPQANALLKTFDGDGATITYGGLHFWPYGLNYEQEMSDEAADRHVQIVNAMINDGMILGGGGTATGCR